MKLHPVTWITIVAAVLSLGADLNAVKALFAAMEQIGPLDAEGGRAYSEVIGRVLHDIAWSLSIFASAAIVEFLYRIWQELRAGRG